MKKSGIISIKTEAGPARKWAVRGVFAGVFAVASCAAMLADDDDMAAQNEAQAAPRTPYAFSPSEASSRSLYSGKGHWALLDKATELADHAAGSQWQKDLAVAMELAATSVNECQMYLKLHEIESALQAQQTQAQKDDLFLSVDIIRHAVQPRAGENKDHSLAFLNRYKDVFNQLDIYKNEKPLSVIKDIQDNPTRHIVNYNLYRNYLYSSQIPMPKENFSSNLAALALAEYLDLLQSPRPLGAYPDQEALYLIIDKAPQFEDLIDNPQDRIRLSILEKQRESEISALLQAGRERGLDRYNERHQSINIYNGYCRPERR
jgi:hypothetical protein